MSFNSPGKGLDRLATAIDKLDATLNKVLKTMGQVDDVGTKAMAGPAKATDLLNASVKLLGKGLSMVGQVGKRTFGAMRSAVSWFASGVVSASAMAAKALGSVASDALTSGGSYLLNMTKFREQTNAALTFSLGSGKAAATTMGYIDRIADALGTSSAEAFGQFRELTAGGFKKGESEMLVQLAADMKIANAGQAVALNALIEPLQAIKRNEVLTAGSFKGLESIGMGTRVYDVLADELHIALADPEDTNATKRLVDQALMSMQLRGQKAADFWTKINLKALDEKAAGEKAKEFHDTTITGSLEKIQNKWDSLMKAMGNTAGGKQLVRILQQVAGALDPATVTGGKLFAVLDRIGATGAKMLARIDLTQVVGWLGQAADAVEKFLVELQPLGEGFMQGFGEAFDTVSEVIDIFSKGDQSSRGFGEALQMVGTALGYLVVGVGAGIGAIAYLEAQLAQLAGVTLGAAGAIGVAIIDGIANGLDSAKAKLIDRLRTLTALLPDTVRRLLDIHSPSRVFMKLGAFSAEGLALGMEGGAPDVEAAAREAVAGATSAASNVKPAAKSKGGPSTFAPVINITVNGGGEDSMRLAQRIREEVTAIFQGLALEMGVPAPSGDA